MLINNLKKLFFNVYLHFFRKIKRGKGIINQLIIRTFGTAVYEIDKIKLFLNPVSTVDRNLLTKGVHDLFVKNIIQQRLSSGGILIDIGANIGYFSILASKIPNTLTIAFEPSPRELKRFYKNIVENNCQNRIMVFPFILSDKNEEIEFFISPMENPGKNSILKRPGSSLLQEMIPARRFDSIVTDNILHDVKVVKIDVEGAEINVLEGMRNVISKMIHAVFIIEISPSLLKYSDKTAEDIYNFFKEYGYTWQRGPDFSEQYDELFLKRNKI